MYRIVLSSISWIMVLVNPAACQSLVHQDKPHELSYILSPSYLCLVILYVHYGMHGHIKPVNATIVSPSSKINNLTSTNHTEQRPPLMYLLSPGRTMLRRTPWGFLRHHEYIEKSIVCKIPIAHNMKFCCKSLIESGLTTRLRAVRNIIVC